MPRDIDLTFDISTGALTLDRVVGNYVKRSETLTLSVTIVSNGASATIPAGLVGTLKPVNTYGTTLAQWTTFSQVGATNVYTASTTINAAAVTTLLGTTTEQANCVLDFAGAGVVESDTLALVLKNNVTRDDDTAPTALLNRNDFLVSNGTGLLVNVAAGYAANGAFVAAQSSVAITNATNYIEVTAAGVASVNTTAFTAGSYPLATVVASAGAITANTDLRAWITPKPAVTGGVTSVAQSFTGGIISVAGSPVTSSGTLALTVAGTSGGIPYFSSGTTWATSAALAASALVVGGGAGAAPATITTGANVLTALGVAVGSAGAFITFNGNAGTPSALVGTNITGTATGLTAGNATLAATVTVANEASDTTCFPLFVTAATGSLAALSNAGLTFNSATGLLSAPLLRADTVSDNAVTGVSSAGGTGVVGQTVSGIAVSASVSGSGDAFSGFSSSGRLLSLSGADGENFVVANNGQLTLGGFGPSGIIVLNGSASGSATITVSATGVLALPAGTTGSITGNAGTVTTNANLTGHVTSVGNAAVLGSFTYAQLNTAVSDADLARTDAANSFTGVQSMTSPDITTSITTPSTTFALVNATATTVNFAGGASTALNIGNASGTNTITGATTSFPLGTTTGSTTTSGIAVAANSLTTGTGVYLASSTLTSGKALDIQVSGTAAAASQTALNVATAGANGTSGITSKGAVISNTHTGTTSTNTALELTASGGTTNVALNATAGHVLVPDGSYTYNTSVSPSIGRSAVAANATTQAGILLGDNTVSILTNSIRGFTISGYGAFGNTALITGIGTNALTFYNTVISTSVLQAGQDKTSTPDTGTLRGGGGSGTNIAGGALHIQGGASTGSAAGGSILLRTTPAGGAGSSANAAVTALTIDSTQAATFSGTLAVTGATTLTGNLTSNGAYISTPQALSGNGAVAAVNLTTEVTTIANTGTANTTTTLGAGTNGQKKVISFITDGGFDAVITVTNPAWGGAGTITMNDALDNVMLIYLNSVWQVFINNGCTLA